LKSLNSFCADEGFEIFGASSKPTGVASDLVVGRVINPLDIAGSAPM